MLQNIFIDAPTSSLSPRVVRNTLGASRSRELTTFTSAEPRHLLFEQEAVGLHLHLMLDTEAWQTVVVGQILKLDVKAGSIAERPLELVADGRVVARTSSNEQGEFQMTAAVDGPVALHIRLADGRLVEVIVDEMVHELETLPMSA